MSALSVKAFVIFLAAEELSGEAADSLLDMMEEVRLSTEAGASVMKVVVVEMVLTLEDVRMTQTLDSVAWRRLNVWTV